MPEYNNTESINIAVTIRMGRAALGMSQQELADRIGVSKITLARVETLESNLKAESYLKIIKTFHELGVEVETMLNGGVHLHVTTLALQQALAQLQDNSMRRSDRKKRESST